LPLKRAALRAEIVQARDAASAIVEEVREQSCTLLLIGLVRSRHRGLDQLGKLVPYILSHTRHGAWLIQESPVRSLR